MTLRILRYGLALLAVLAVLSGTRAQPGKDKKPPAPKPKVEKDDLDEYRRLFKKPETVEQFWNAMQFEIDVGRYDLAAAHLRGLLAKKPTEADLLELEQKVGMTPFLQLRTISTWSRDPKENKEALANVETLIRLVTQAVRKKLADPERIRGFIKALTGTPEERAYAVQELYKSGAVAVPYLIDALHGSKDPEERLAILRALQRLGPEAIPPLVAALDSNDTLLKADILDILKTRYRYAREIIPHLWFVYASKEQPELVRTRAARVLADFLDVPVGKLPPAKYALTQEAERYFKHEVPFGDPDAVVVWRWDGKGVVQGFPGAPTVLASQAEEYWGLRFARLALTLDPGYRPAQVVFLSLALEKAAQRGGPTVPLSRTQPAASELLSKSSPDLVLAVLDRALTENRLPVILAIVRNLGDRAEVLAERPGYKGQPPLVRALYVPDRRVQMAAAEALLRIPPLPGLPTYRVVDVFRRALAAEPTGKARPKVVVGYFEVEYRDRIAEAVQAAGFTAIKESTGKNVLRRLNEAADIDLILADADLPDPGLAYLLAQVRADRNSGHVPIVLTVNPPRPAPRPLIGPPRRYELRPDQAAVLARLRNPKLPSADVESAISAAGLIPNADAQAALAAMVATMERPLGQRLLAARALVGSVQKFGFLLTQTQMQPLQVLALRDGLDPGLKEQLNLLLVGLQANERIEKLQRFVERYPAVAVMDLAAALSPETLRGVLTSRIADLGSPTLAPAEMRDYAERSIRALANMALGTPRGYDIRPAANTILDALRANKLSPEGMLSAIIAAGRLPGSAAQAELAHTITDDTRPAPQRVAATVALIRSFQRNGLLLTAAQVQPLRELAAQDKIDPDLKAQLANLIGSLKPDDRLTGERLREYSPRVVPVVPPPKE